VADVEGSRIVGLSGASPNAIKRSARLYLQALLAGVLLIFTGTAMDLALARMAGGLLIAAGEIPLVLALRRSPAPNRPWISQSIMWVGLAGVGVGVVAAVAPWAAVGPVLLGSVGVALDGVWLVAVGALSPSIQRSLRGFAIVGGLGWLLLPVVDLIGSPGSILIPLVGLVGLSGFAFVLALARGRGLVMALA